MWNKFQSTGFASKYLAVHELSLLINCGMLVSLSWLVKSNEWLLTIQVKIIPSI